MGPEKSTQQYVNSLKSTVAHVILPMQKYYLVFKKQLNFPLVYLFFDSILQKKLWTLHANVVLLFDVKYMLHLKKSTQQYVNTK